MEIDSDNHQRKNKWETFKNQSLWGNQATFVFTNYQFKLIRLWLLKIANIILHFSFIEISHKINGICRLLIINVARKDKHLHSKMTSNHHPFDHFNDAPHTAQSITMFIHLFDGHSFIGIFVRVARFEGRKNFEF